VNFYLGLLVGCFLTVLALVPIFMVRFRRVRKDAQDQVDQIKMAHKTDWETLIHKLNHTGSIPHAATATGLIGLILSAVSRCITSLEALLIVKDWDTREVITELRGIAMVELSLLHKKLGDFLEAQRRHLKEFDYKQHD